MSATIRSSQACPRRREKNVQFFSRSVFIFKMKKTIIEYVFLCSACQFFKFSKLLFYDQFQPIKTPTESLKKLSLDFILALSMTFKNSNIILTIINYFFKWIKVISKNKTMKAENQNKFY